MKPVARFFPVPLDGTAQSTSHPDLSPKTVELGLVTFPTGRACKPIFSKSTGRVYTSSELGTRIHRRAQRRRPQMLGPSSISTESQTTILPRS